MDLKKGIIKFLATGAMTGYMPVAPGTAGTLPGVVIYMLISPLPLWLNVTVTIAVIIFSIPLASTARPLFGGKDPSYIVCDEVAGLLVAALFIPVSLFNIILVFILFRFFDILKPYPASLIDRTVEGGAGIVLDDVVAGAYANISVHIIIKIFG